MAQRLMLKLSYFCQDGLFQVHPWIDVGTRCLDELCLAARYWALRIP